MIRLAAFDLFCYQLPPSSSLVPPDVTCLVSATSFSRGETGCIFLFFSPTPRPSPVPAPPLPRSTLNKKWSVASGVARKRMMMRGKRTRSGPVLHTLFQPRCQRPRRAVPVLRRFLRSHGCMPESRHHLASVGRLARPQPFQTTGAATVVFRGVFFELRARKHERGGHGIHICAFPPIGLRSSKQGAADAAGGVASADVARLVGARSLFILCNLVEVLPSPKNNLQYAACRLCDFDIPRHRRNWQSAACHVCVRRLAHRSAQTNDALHAAKSCKHPRPPRTPPPPGAWARR